MQELTVLEVTSVPSKEALRLLLFTASTFGEVFGLVSEIDRDVDPEGDLLTGLEPYLIGRQRVMSWPGTTTDEPMLVSRYAATKGSLSVLADGLPDLFGSGDWDSPRDLHFLRADETPVFVTISTEDEAWFELRQDELGQIGDPTIQLLGLRRPGPPATIHTAAVYADQADTLIDAPVDNEGSLMEKLPCRQLAPELFEVCCIPFHQDDLALADIVRATRVDDHWLLDRKVQSSGRIVAEVLVSQIRNSPVGVAEQITINGFDIEWLSDRWILVDVADDRDFERLIDVLIPGVVPPGLSAGAR